MLNAKLTRLKLHFGIFQLTDWQSVEPSWILAQDGCGPATLDYIRVLLANHGLTLKNDRTPEFWKQHYRDVKIIDQLSDDEEGTDRGVMNPFVVLIDTAETHPFGFAGMRCDSDQEYRPLIVPTEQRALGRHPDSLGDYSLDTGVGRCHVERKSLNDLQGTLLGFRANGDGTSRRERFERELENLAAMPAGLVVIESAFEEVIAKAPATDHRQPQENAKILYRSVVSLQQKFRVPWMFAGTRRLAEKFTFDWLRKFFEEQQEARKAESRALRKMQKAPGTVQVQQPVTVSSLF